MPATLSPASPIPTLAPPLPPGTPLLPQDTGRPRHPPVPLCPTNTPSINFRPPGYLLRPPAFQATRDLPRPLTLRKILQLVAAHHAATTYRSSLLPQPPDSPISHNPSPGLTSGSRLQPSSVPDGARHRSHPSWTPPASFPTPSLNKHPSRTPPHPSRQPFPLALRAKSSDYPRARRGHNGSRPNLLHRWTPPPTRSLGQRWSPPPVQPVGSPPRDPTFNSLPQPAPCDLPPSKLCILVDLTGPVPQTTPYNRPRPPARGIYRKVFRSRGSSHFPLHQPCFDPFPCL